MQYGILDMVFHLLLPLMSIPALSAYVHHYNERRLHFSLDIDDHETPLMAFRNRKATDAIREESPKWMERDTDD